MFVCAVRRFRAAGGSGYHPFIHPLVLFSYLCSGSLVSTIERKFSECHVTFADTIYSFEIKWSGSTLMFLFSPIAHCTLPEWNVRFFCFSCSDVNAENFCHLLLLLLLLQGFYFKIYIRNWKSGAIRGHWVNSNLWRNGNWLRCILSMISGRAHYSVGMVRECIASTFELISLRCHSAAANRVAESICFNIGLEKCGDVCWKRRTTNAKLVHK